MVDESVTVKGTPARSLQKFIEAELNVDQRDALFRALPAAYAARFRQQILATEVLPVHMLNRMTEEAARVKGEPVASFARRAGREAAGEAVKGIYRFFVMVMTPAALLGRAAPMWSTLYSRGEMRIDEQTPKSARVRLVNFPSETTGCARVTGWMERLIELTGVEGRRVEHTQCVAAGKPACEWKIEWK